MSETDHAQHARELAEACGLKPYLEKQLGEGNWIDADGRIIAYFRPHTMRDHLAVVLRECERRKLLPYLTEAVGDVYVRAESVDYGFKAWLFHLFASDPAVICEACYSVLCQQQKGT